MFFKTDSKIDSQTGVMSIYYRLVESYRDVLGNTRHRTVLSVGRMDGITPEPACVKTKIFFTEYIKKKVYLCGCNIKKI